MTLRFAVALLTPTAVEAWLRWPDLYGRNVGCVHGPVANAWRTVEAAGPARAAAAVAQLRADQAGRVPTLPDVARW